MPAFPQQNGDKNIWGTSLRDFFSLTFDLSTGAILDGKVLEQHLDDGAVTPVKLFTTTLSAPTGLLFSSGTSIAEDGTVVPWLRATWTANPEADIVQYEWRIKEGAGNYVYGLSGTTDQLWQPVKPNVAYSVGLRAIDRVGNRSAWSADVQTVTSRDQIAPGVPTGLSAVAAFHTVFLSWTNPADRDLLRIDVYRASTNDSSLATKIGAAPGTTYSDEGLAVGQTFYYWLKAVDTSLNQSAFSGGQFSGVQGTTAQIVSTDLVDGAVLSAKLADSAVITSKLAAGAVDNAKLAALAVDAAKLADSAVTATKIANAAVGSAAIANLAVGIAHIQDAAIQSAKIGDLQVLTAKIADLGVTTAKMADLAVTNAKIAALAVDDAKINDLNASKITAGDIATARLSVNAGAAVNAGTTDLAAARMQANAAAAVNAGSTTILPGLIAVSGATTLADWRYGGDLTLIDGGDIAANTITANKVSIGSRGLTIEGCEISAQTPTANTLYWSAGTITHPRTVDGVIVSQSVTGGNALWSTGTLYLYWSIGGFDLSTTTDAATAFASTNVVLASYRGGTDLVVNYGRTIIDGSDIVTGTITANRLAANTITANEIAAGTITADRMAAGTITAASGILANAVITTAKIADGQITTAKIGSAQITTALINDLAVTSAKINDLNAAKINAGTLTVTSSGVAIDVSSGGRILLSAGGDLYLDTSGADFAEIRFRLASDTANYFTLGRYVGGVLGLRVNGITSPQISLGEAGGGMSILAFLKDNLLIYSHAGTARFEFRSDATDGAGHDLDLFRAGAKLHLGVRDTGSGTGSPEGVVTAGPGTVLVAYDYNIGGVKMWIKRSGTGNADWAVVGTQT